MRELIDNKGTGWWPDLIDLRDYTPSHKEVQPLLRKAKLTGALRAALPRTEDLRPWCPPIEDQGSLGSCTANAGVGLMEYFEKRAFGKHIDASRLFLYKVTRNLLQWTGDTGAFLRTTMAAMRLFGVPPAQYYPYDISQFDDEPPAFCYAFAQNYQALKYFRLDRDVSGDNLLKRIKSYTHAGFPSMFGFPVFNSISQAASGGEIPYPAPDEGVAGGHAIVAVGYDDRKKIKNTAPGGSQTTGALLIRNSWGTSWGDNGYGWLPYKYVQDGLATDWWSLMKGEWIDTNRFGL